MKSFKSFIKEAKQTKLSDSEITTLLQRYGYAKRNLSHLAQRMTKITKKKHTVKGDSIYIEEGTNQFPKEAASIQEEVTQAQLNDLEKFADRLLKKFDVDVEFTKHFADRMNDSRNKPLITVSELKLLFMKIANAQAKNIKAAAGSEVVIKDMQSDLNLPVVIKFDRRQGEFDVVNKTIMRKKNFKTPDKTINYK